MAGNWKPGEIVVEMAGEPKTVDRPDGSKERYGPRCSNVASRTFGTTLRGRWRTSDLPDSGSARGYGAMPDIPGQCVAIDVKRRTIRAVDPLRFPEYAATLRHANSIRKPFEGTEFRPFDDMEIRNPTATDVKTCLLELRGLVDGGSATEREGHLPSTEEILAMDGDLRVRHHYLRTMHDGKQESPFATPEETEQMAQPREERVRVVPAGSP